MDDRIPLHGRIEVPGEPVGKGSFKAFVPKGAEHPIITNDNARTKPWEARVALAAKQQWPHGVCRGGVRMHLYFTFTRPKGHYGTGRNAGRVKDSAPAEKLTTPDIDKLQRAVLDALTGIVYADDKQVLDVRQSKRFGDAAGVLICINSARREPVTVGDYRKWGAKES